MRLAALLLLSSCAALRTGWARVDFLTGKPTDVMVCSFVVDAEGDTEGKCADFDEMQEGLGAAGHDFKLRSIRGTK